MDGEDVFGRKISTRYARNVFQPAYSSDEGYGTATAAAPPPSRNAYAPPTNVRFIALFFLKPFVLIVLLVTLCRCFRQFSVPFCVGGRSSKFFQKLRQCSNFGKDVAETGYPGSQPGSYCVPLFCSQDCRQYAKRLLIFNANSTQTQRAALSSHVKII